MTATLLICCFAVVADPGGEARAVFAAKCLACHGADLSKPKGGFGYVLDLKRVAANPDLVVPGKPDESNLWTLIIAGNMPPNGSPTGPLNDAQLWAVKGWIEAGAPEPLETPPVPVPDGAGGEGAKTGGAPFWPRLGAYAGRYHLLILHFPIVLMLVAAGLELWYWRWWKVVEPQPAVRICLLLAAFVVAPTTVLGWLHANAGNGASQPEVLMAHKWAGTGATALILACAWINERDWRAKERTAKARTMIFATAIEVATTGHFGGALVHGAEFLTW